MTDKLVLWTVYDHPSDYPDAFLARKSLIGTGISVMTHEVLVSKELEVIRQELREQGLVCLPRDLLDDPVIVEVWF